MNTKVRKMMKIAAISDIHGNLPALETVLTEIEREAVDEMIVCGDVIAGPMPAEVCARLRALSIPTRYILGNAETWLIRHLEGQPINAFSPRGNEETVWYAAKLSENAMAWIRTWEMRVALDIPRLGGVLFCHATPQNNMDVFTAETPEEKAMPFFEGVTAKLVVCGHTHMQYERTIGEIRVCNTGSIGMPFGAPGAHWLLLEDGKIEFRQTAYDREAAAKLIRATDYPAAEEFATGNVLSVPSKEEALAFMGALEAKQAAERDR